MQKSIVKRIIAVFCALFICSATIVGVAVWNKYQPSFTIKDTLADGGGQKAVVILLGGQSNASGCSHDDCLQQNVSAEKYAQYKNGYDNVYINYIAGHNRSNGFVKCSTLQGELEGCFGPELGMAEQLNEKYPDQLFFIIKCAWGATDLFEQWLSPSSDGKTGKLYKQFVAYVEDSMKYLVAKNYNVQIEGMCWMQGESDSFSVEHAKGYEEHLENFINDIRRKFKRYQSNDGIAFVDAYIADNPMYWVFCEYVNQSKLAVANKSPINVVIDTVSEGLSCSSEPFDKPDVAHYDSLSQIKLGKLFINEVSAFLD